MLQPADARMSGVPGVDRVLWLQVRLHDAGPCDGIVHGVRHRRPVDVRVKAEVVHRLVAAGVPVVRTGA